MSQPTNPNEVQSTKAAETIDERERIARDNLEKVTKFFEGPMAFYNQARKDGEYDLVARVRQAFVEHGCEQLMQETFDVHPHILEAKTKTAHAQQYHLNRYFSMQLMAADGDTKPQRYLLSFTSSPDEWYTIFKEGILPALLHYGLPKRLIAPMSL